MNCDNDIFVLTIIAFIFGFVMFCLGAFAGRKGVT